MIPKTEQSVFLVTTDESVEGTYVVQAGSAEEARAKFGNPRIEWQDVEQTGYMAYSCEVREVR